MSSMFDTVEAMDFIGRRLRAIEGQKFGGCARRAGKPLQECWCINAGPDGATLPCPSDVAEASVTTAKPV